MIVAGEGNPFGAAPGVVLVNVTATLIHPQVLLTDRAPLGRRVS